MIAAAERAELLRPVLRALETFLELRVRSRDARELALERGGRMHRLSSFLVLIAPDRDVARNLIENALERLLIESVGRKRRARSDHAATEIHPHCGGDHRLLRCDHATDRRSDARMHVGHGSDVMMDDRKTREIHELLARARL